MPLSWNEIKDRALRISREWPDESRETAAQAMLDARAKRRRKAAA